MLDLLRSGIRMLIKKRLASYHKSRCTETALLAVVVHKRLLDQMQIPRLAQSFHGSDGPALGVNRQYGTRVSSFAVQQNSTSAASPAITYTLCASQLKRVAQSVQQSNARLQRGAMLLAVNVKSNRHLARPLSGNFFRSSSENSSLGQKRHSSADAGNFQEVAARYFRAGSFFGFALLGFLVRQIVHNCLQ